MSEDYIAIFESPGFDIEKTQINVPKGIKVTDVVRLVNVKKNGRIPWYWLVYFTVDFTADKGLPSWQCQEMFDELESKLGVEVIRGFRDDDGPAEVLKSQLGVLK